MHANNNFSFIQNNVITGRVLEVQQSSVLQSKTGKIFSLLLEGAPYQFSHQQMRTTIFIEPVNAYSNDTESIQRSITYFGDITGIAKGNIIQARVKNHRGSLVAKQLNNITTQSSITPSPQVPSLLILLAILLLVAIIVYATFTITTACINGVLLNNLLNLGVGVLNGVFPILAGLAFVFILYTSLKK